MAELTKEQLIEKLERRLAVTKHYPDVEEAQLDAEIFKIALAALTAGVEREPIYQLRDVDWYDTDKRTYDTVVNTGGAGRIVYAVPQLPQPLPDEHTRREVNVGGNTWVQCSKHAYDKAKSKGEIVRELYERPQLPQPAVPDEMTAGIAVKYWSGGHGAIECFVAGCNFFRAAMLQGNHRDLSYPVDPQVAAYEKIMKQAVHDGWVAVPVEPTPEMLAEICLVDGWTERALQARYKAMLAASPKRKID